MPDKIPTEHTRDMMRAVVETIERHARAVGGWRTNQAFLDARYDDPEQIGEIILALKSAVHSLLHEVHTLAHIEGVEQMTVKDAIVAFLATRRRDWTPFSGVEEGDDNALKVCEMAGIAPATHQNTAQRRIRAALLELTRAGRVERWRQSNYDRCYGQATSQYVYRLVCDEEK